ncbi:hypothetical protein NQ314_014743 [Rhamnusium bicolor]|uniref:Uncharacterized protein n=1 Tax=Rhamnusium bicolor TaxID=1586634 RepID=A0AAV8X1N3_9CUCU|nr:hypothetical protein NQ314_014743 [Rhamnusium bicolor]
MHEIDIAHLDINNLYEMSKHKKISVVVVIYVTCLMVHLSCANYDNKLSLMSYRNISFVNVSLKLIYLAKLIMPNLH